MRTLLELWLSLTTAGLVLLGVVVTAQAAVGHLRRGHRTGAGTRGTGRHGRTARQGRTAPEDRPAARD